MSKSGSEVTRSLIEAVAKVIDPAWFPGPGQCGNLSLSGRDDALRKAKEIIAIIGDASARKDDVFVPQAPEPVMGSVLLEKCVKEVGEFCENNMFDTEIVVRKCLDAAGVKYVD